MLDIQPRTWRLIKLTALYLIALLAAIVSTIACITFVVVHFGPLALVLLFAVLLLIIPALHYAKKRMEEIERETERRLKKDW